MKKIREIIEKIASENNNIENYAQQLVKELDCYRNFDAYSWNINEIDIIENKLAEITRKNSVSYLYQHLLQQKDTCNGEGFELLKYLCELNLLKNKTKSLSTIQNLISLYPENHIFSYFFIKMVYDNNENDLNLLIASQQQGCDITMKSIGYASNHTYTVISMNLCIRLFNKYIGLHDFDSAEKLVTELDNINPFIDDISFNNVLATLPFTIEQNKALFNLNQKTLNEMENKVNKLNEDNNKKSYEILIIFTAVITFLITAANNTASDNTSIAGLASFGFTLLVFIVASIICLERPENLFRDVRVAILILALLSSLAMALIDKYDKFDLWADKSIYISFPLKNDDKETLVEIPFKLK